MKKICIVTSSRADFGLLKGLIIKMKRESEFIIKVIAAGNHFSKKYGYTYYEIKKNKIKIDKKIKNYFSSDNALSISKIFSKSLFESTKILKRIDPDLLLVLGDRYEILASVIAANLLRIPVGHIHGGEVTSGALDDVFRHSITKMSHIHFCANKIYKNRIIQLGENPRNVHIVGGLGVESILETKVQTKEDLEKKFKLKFLKNNLLVCFHPETINKKSTKYQIKVILSALKKIKNKCLIFTSPGPDSENFFISQEIKKFVKKNANTYFFKSLGQLNYFSFLRHVDGVVGNSSSGILEVPYFNIGTINVGSRQTGRLMSKSIINTNFKKDKIIYSINKILSKKFKDKLKKMKKDYFYGNGGTSDKIIKILKKKNLNNIFVKHFYDQKNKNLKKI